MPAAILARCRRPTLLLAGLLAAVAPVAPAAAVDTKFYAGASCRPAAPPPVLQPTYGGNGVAFNQNSNGELHLICPMVRDGARLQEAQVRVIAHPHGSVICVLRTLRSDGSVQQSERLTHKPVIDGPTIVELRFGGQAAPSTGTGYYGLECQLPPRSVAGGIVVTAGLIMYRVVEAD